VKTVEYWLPDFDWFGVAAAFGFAGAQRECQQYAGEGADSGDEEYVAVGLCFYLDFELLPQGEQTGYASLLFHYHDAWVNGRAARLQQRRSISHELSLLCLRSPDRASEQRTWRGGTRVG